MTTLRADSAQANGLSRAEPMWAEPGRANGPDREVFLAERDVAWDGRRIADRAA